MKIKKKYDYKQFEIFDKKKQKSIMNNDEFKTTVNKKSL